MISSASLATRRVLTAALVVCIVLIVYGYTTGWPAWLLLITLLSWPLLAFSVWMFTGRWRRYRFLYGIYGTLALAAVFEAWEYGRIPPAIAQSIDLPKPPGEPNLYFTYDLPGIEAQLFPDHPDTQLLQAIQLNYCSNGGPMYQLHPFCSKYSDAGSQAIRDLLENAVSKMPKTNEDIYYSYVDVLIRTGADRQKIDAAAEQWKKLFPLSKRPDPRLAPNTKPRNDTE